MNIATIPSLNSLARTPSPKTLTESLLTALRDRGAREMFGIPGDFALPFFKVAEESRILPLSTLSHEPAVGFAADGAARSRRSLGVAAVTYGAGAYNMINAIAGAYAEKSPIVVISGAPGRKELNSGLHIHHQGKSLETQMNVYREVTVAQTRLDDPISAPIEIARVLQAAIDHSRPVYIEVPRDMADVPIGPIPASPSLPNDAISVSACAEAIMKRLALAVRPVLMVDLEVKRYGLEDDVAALAVALQIPVVTTFTGYSLLSASSVPPLGVYLGSAGDPDIASLVHNSDGLFLLGVLPCDTNFGTGSLVDLAQTIQARDGKVWIDSSVFLDVPLGSLVKDLLKRAHPIGASHASITPRTFPRGLISDGKTIHPTDIARGINDLFDLYGTMPIVADMGDCLFTAMDIIPTEFIAPGYYAGMGFGVPAGMGAQYATGQRTIILVGDGAFQMTGWELGNCRRLGVDPIVIVFDNRGWEMLRTFQPESKFNDLDDWHFAEMAKSLGGTGHHVRTRSELSSALKKAIESRGVFQLINAEIPRGNISDTIAQFVRLFGKSKPNG